MCQKSQQINRRRQATHDIQNLFKTLTLSGPARRRKSYQGCCSRRCLAVYDLKSNPALLAPVRLPSILFQDRFGRPRQCEKLR